MASSVVFKLSCLVLACMAISAPKGAKADISCDQVVRNLTPCISYVANGGSVAAACCSGIKSLYDAAKTTADRKSVCKCLKQAINGIPYTSYNLGLAAGLPNKCGVNLPYKISPSADCNKYIWSLPLSLDLFAFSKFYFWRIFTTSISHI